MTDYAKDHLKVNNVIKKTDGVDESHGKHVVKHEGDCSIWGCSMEGVECDICDCGALHRSIFKNPTDEVVAAWAKHQAGITRSFHGPDDIDKW